jgi:hypothetical protein
MKIKFSQIAVENLKSVLSDFMGRKPILSNYFIQDLTDFDSFQSLNTLLLRVKENYYYRIYIISCDLSELNLLLLELSGSLVINVPTKIEPLKWIEILEKSGFSRIGVYERYINFSFDSNDTFSATYAEIADFDLLKKQLYGSFDPRIDWLPQDAELTKMIYNKQIIVNKENGIVTGFIIFTLIGKKCYLNCWLDFSGNGLFLFSNILALMKAADVNYYYFWVNKTNTRVKKMHRLLGAKPDGLLDYTYFKS